MLLTITTTHRPATDIGYLLGKNPNRLQSFPVAVGQVHVFYPVAREDECTVALLMDIDPVALVRGRRGSGTDAGLLGQYVNDRPYVASSFLSVAIASVFGSGMKGYTKDRPELADTPIPLTARIPTVPCRGGESFLRKLFEPLGYRVECRQLPLDDRFPEWGESSYFSVTISANSRLKDLLTHLYVLLPVLDNDKHYWVGPDEIQKLLDRGAGWLEKHPEREQIVSRYLKRRGYLVREALARLVADEDAEPEETEETRGNEEQALEAPLSLNEQRMGAVLSVLKDVGAKRVIDLGCGEGRLLQSLLKEKAFQRIVGVDVSLRALEIAKTRLDIERMPETQRNRIEHLELSRLTAFERVVFEYAHPPIVVITTPDAEYNAVFTTLPAGQFRHGDHRFEWTRPEFEQWSRNVAERFGYSVRFLGIGDEVSSLGTPTQMAVFSR
ncbi:MAG: 3' terminal RNA ribose 2'-O-methyltransferase Hen1 [Acidobacteria bacterium]|nr:MAG: 3' terminal RNA ribose 2'-O-methyltransferase Hen1 [Acidobacteriota bacterium]